MQDFKPHLVLFEDWLKGHLKFSAAKANSDESSPRASLGKAMNYSLFGGGKRFRPLLAILAYKLFQPDEQVVYPYAAALEMVHSYSLIHDDLPCMDDDDFRRGQPTNHKQFGEDIALLAGDALISEAFLVIASSYKKSPSQALELITLLAESIGPHGMVLGQVLDLKSTDPSSEQMKEIHQLKTGALINAAVVGGGKIAKAEAAEIKKLEQFSEAFGEAFQVADDIQDFAEKSSAGGEASIVTNLGEAEAKKYLSQLTSQATALLQELSENSSDLVRLVNFNLSRAL